MTDQRIARIVLPVTAVAFVVVAYWAYTAPPTRDAQRMETLARAMYDAPYHAACLEMHALFSDSGGYFARLDAGEDTVGRISAPTDEALQWCLEQLKDEFEARDVGF